MLISPFVQSVNEAPDAACLYRLDGDAWTAFSRQTVFDAALKLCGRWKHDGLNPGDLADIDPDGHIRIVGRLKDLIVNSGGDNIAPAPIEQEITLYPEVDQIVVVGDAKPWLSAVICLNPDFETQDPQALVYDILKRYNKDKPSLVQLRKAIVMDEPCSIENGLLTPTQKIKRPKLIALYREAIDALYGPMASSE